jgi:hypothetical protein
MGWDGMDNKMVRQKAYLLVLLCVSLSLLMQDMSCTVFRTSSRPQYCLTIASNQVTHTNTVNNLNTC